MRFTGALVGMKHRGAEVLVASLPEGEPLTLVREPDNRHDRMAVQVWARGRHVGYVAAKQVRPLAVFMDAHLKQPAAMPQNVDGYSLAARLHISADRYPLVQVEPQQGRER